MSTDLDARTGLGRRFWPLLALTLSLAAPALAADKTTRHSLTLPDGPLAFSAMVETQKLAAPDGKTVAEIVTTAFTGDGAGRPVTFAFNGGPGAASAYLDMAAIGPWRVPIVLPITPSQDPAPVDNAETWLAFTDLVFIDPPGTGYSRWTGDGPDAGKPFLTVDGDIRTLATIARRWLEAHDRLGSRVFLAGESYGGFRAPLLARALLEQQGVGVAGIVMISPVLDFNGRDSAYDPIRRAVQLPSVAAAYAGARSRAENAAAEAYAAGPYIADLLAGPDDGAAQDRIARTLAPLTGLDPALIRRRAGRLDWGDMLRNRHPGSVATPYDARLEARDPFPAAPTDHSPDPILDGLKGPLTSAMLALYHGRLQWQPDGAPNRQYTLLSEELNGQWDYGRSNNRPESMTALRQYLALDPAARALVVHGLYDLVTPYFADALLLAQVPASAAGGRLALKVYAGGHMFYLDEASRRALMQDARALVIGATAAAPDPPPPASTPR